MVLHSKLRTIIRRGTIGWLPASGLVTCNDRGCSDGEICCALHPRVGFPSNKYSGFLLRHHAAFRDDVQSVSPTQPLIGTTCGLEPSSRRRFLKSANRLSVFTSANRVLNQPMVLPHLSSSY